MTDGARIPDEHMDELRALIEEALTVTARDVAALEQRYGQATMPTSSELAVATEASRAAWDQIVEFLERHNLEITPPPGAPKRDPRLNALMARAGVIADRLASFAPQKGGKAPEEPTGTVTSSTAPVIVTGRQDPPSGTVTVSHVTARPSVPNVFAQGAAPVPSSHPIVAVMRAIQSSLREWDDADGNTVPTYTMVTNTGSKYGPGRVTVSVRPSPGESRPGDVLPALWQSVRELDDLCSDVLLVCLAQWSSLARGPHESVRITADAILDARGTKRITHAGESGNWQHGHRTDDRIAAGRALAQLASLWLEVTNVGIGLRTKKLSRITIESSPALAIVGLREQLDTEGRRVLLDATVMPGDWARTYWELGLRQTAVLAQKALAYEAQKEQPEKRLAKYFAFAFRWNAHQGGDTIERRVATLLENAGIEANRRWPQRTRTRLEQALDRLKKDDVIAAWSSVIGPKTKLPPQGWLKHWLTQTIRIDAPEIIIEQYAHLKPKAGRLEKKLAKLTDRLDRLDGGPEKPEI